MTDKTEAIKLAKIYGLRTLPEGVDRIHIINYGPNACDAIVSREEFYAAPERGIDVGETYVFDRFSVSVANEPLIATFCDGDRLHRVIVHV